MTKHFKSHKAPEIDSYQEDMGIKQILFGTFGVGVVVVIIASIAGIVNNTYPQKVGSSFKVIDQWNGCNVIEWNYASMKERKYFLDCRQTND